MRTLRHIDPLSLLLALIVIVIAAGAALAHSHYDWWCCNGKDCRPYFGTVQETPGGFYLPEYEVTIPYKSADGVHEYADIAGTRYNLPPEVHDDAQYHICVLPHEPKRVRCFYAKPGGV